MKITVRELTGKEEILSACRVTVWKGDAEKEPSPDFMHKIYRSEHSPIRDRIFVVKVEGIPYWVSTHFVRHSIGYTPYVSTQRSDRIEYEGERGARRQDELVNMRITLNAQSFINISKVRLCNMASPETRDVWNKITSELNKIDNELYMCCVPSCVYRGFCPEGNQNTCFKGKQNWREVYVKHQLSK